MISLRTKYTQIVISFHLSCLLFLVFLCWERLLKESIDSFDRYHIILHSFFYKSDVLARIMEC